MTTGNFTWLLELDHVTTSKSKIILSAELLLQRKQWKHQNVWNLFEVNNKDTRKTSIQPVCRLYKLWTYSIHCPGESVFESADWVKCPSYDNYSKAALLKYENQVVTKRCHSDLLTKTGEKYIFDQHSWHYVHKNQKSIEKNLNNIDTPKTKPNFATTVLEIVFREKTDFYW